MATDTGSSNPQKSPSGEANVPTHPLVQKALGAGEDPQPSPWVTLIGYVGPSQKTGNVRLYLGSDFQSYYEIPRSAIGPVASLDRQDENSPTQVYVKGSAVVNLVQIQTGPASYLQGSIAGQYMAAAIGHGAIGPYAIPQTRHTACYLCHGAVAQELVQAPHPSPSLFCPSYNIPCVSQFGCTHHLPCTQRPFCGPVPEAELVYHVTQNPVVCHFTQFGCTHNVLCRPTPGTGGICTNYPHGQLC
jgi:hypothetical protein